MNLFFAAELNEKGGRLGKDESHHASRVLRLGPSDSILTTQGKGVIYQSEIVSATKSEVIFRNTKVHQQEPEPGRQLHIAIAPTKSNDRFEFFLEKATEIGISRITPVICDHSERKVYKTERGQKIVTSAAKQSLACWWPVLDEPQRLSDFSADESFNKFIAHCESDDIPSVLPELSQMNKVLMLIGPEGDFSSSEIVRFKKEGYQEASLGKKRLRTETAGLAVALAFNLR